MTKVRFVGLDVHAATVAVAEPTGAVQSLGEVPNRLGPADSVRRVMRRGPTGYVIY